MLGIILRILSFPGAVIRWYFFRLFGSKVELEEYVAHHFILNGTVAILAFITFLIGYGMVLLDKN